MSAAVEESMPPFMPIRYGGSWAHLVAPCELHNDASGTPCQNFLVHFVSEERPCLEIVLRKVLSEPEQSMFVAL